MSGRSPRWFTGIKPNTVPITIKLGSAYSSSYAYVTIDDVQYTAATTVEVAPGTIIHAWVGGAVNGTVYLNGTSVLSGRGVTYEHVADGPATITMSRTGSSSRRYAGEIQIVTE